MPMIQKVTISIAHWNRVVSSRAYAVRLNGFRMTEARKRLLSMSPNGSINVSSVASQAIEQGSESGGVGGRIK